jgi:transcriptional regulator with XRE-family HTH domain
LPTKSAFSDPYRKLLADLVESRRAAGLTQHELAERLGRPQSFVSKYERAERRLDVAEFVTISRELAVDPCKLIRKYFFTLK